MPDRSTPSMKRRWSSRYKISSGRIVSTTPASTYKRWMRTFMILRFADMLFREAMTNANALSSCDATYQSTLEITFEGEKISFTSENTVTVMTAGMALTSMMRK